MTVMWKNKLVNDSSVENKLVNDSSVKNTEKDNLPAWQGI